MQISKFVQKSYDDEPFHLFVFLLRSVSVLQPGKMILRQQASPRPLSYLPLPPHQHLNQHQLTAKRNSITMHMVTHTTAGQSKSSKHSASYGQSLHRSSVRSAKNGGKLLLNGLGATRDGGVEVEERLRKRVSFKEKHNQKLAQNEAATPIVSCTHLHRPNASKCVGARQRSAVCG